jgi:hypothetical protein
MLESLLPVCLGDMTFWDFLSAHWAAIAAAGSTLFLAVTGALAWLGKIVWAKFDAWSERRAARAAITADKQDKLIDTLTEHAPLQAALLTKLTASTEALLGGNNGMMQEVHQTKQAAVELSYGLEALGVEDIVKRREELARYMARARERLGVSRRKSSGPERDEQRDD